MRANSHTLSFLSLTFLQPYLLVKSPSLTLWEMSSILGCSSDLPSHPPCVSDFTSLPRETRPLLSQLSHGELMTPLHLGFPPSPNTFHHLLAPDSRHSSSAPLLFPAEVSEEDFCSLIKIPGSRKGLEQTAVTLLLLITLVYCIHKAINCPAYTLCKQLAAAGYNL